MTALAANLDNALTKIVLLIGLWGTLPTSIADEMTPLSPCNPEHHPDVMAYEPASLCAEIEVPEAEGDNPRMLTLSVVVLPATTRERVADPIVLLAGGPGQSAIEVAPDWAARFENLRKTRDFLVIDQRGTGSSSSLACSEHLDPVLESLEAQTANVEEALAAQIAALRECLAHLDADPTHYTSRNAAVDLEFVRQHLDYPALNLFGISYGTRMAFIYARQYPTSVRSLILDAVAPTNMLIPERVALDADLAFQLIERECQSTPSCQSAFPNLQQKLEQAEAFLRDLDQDLLAIDPLTGERTFAKPDPRLINRLLRSALYSRGLRQLVPLAISEAAEGRLEVLLGMGAVLHPESASSGISLGMMASVLCSEDMTQMESMQHGEIFDNALQELLIEVCGFWPHQAVGPEYFEPFRSDTPALLMSGTLDPITPPSYAKEAMESLTSAQHVEILGGTHGVGHLGCMPDLIETFLDDLSNTELDTTCTRSIEPRPFFTSHAGPFARDSDEEALHD